MEQKPNILDELIKQKLEDFELPTAPYDWLRIEDSFDKMSFWRFSFKKFNIFYAGLITMAFLMSVGAVYYSYRTQKYLMEYKDELERQNQHQPALNDTLHRDVSTFPEETEITEQSLASYSTKKEKQEEARTHIAKEIESSTKSVVAGEKEITPLKELATKEVPNKEVAGAEIKETKDSLKLDTLYKPRSKPKKIIYLTKRDTIFKADTVKRVRRK